MVKAPSADCPLCPRLVAFRESNRGNHPQWHNAPVPSFGDLNARLLIVGLGPGLRGANRSGRPFTGDFAGDLLYPTLVRHGFAKGAFAARADDGLRMLDCRITNAVRCVPPQNRPTPAEVATCRAYLAAEIQAMPRLRAILTLGRIAHDSTVRALGEKPSAWPFGHGAFHRLPQGPALACSYHCSRLNTNTGRLTAQMFSDVIAALRQYLEQTA